MIVACKIPNGLVVAGALLNGPSLDPDERKAQVKAKLIFGNYALTYGVDDAAFQEWMKANVDSPLIKNKVVFGAETEGEVVQFCMANRAVKSGFEGALPLA